MALINKLEAIGDAIREKTGTSDLLTLDEMATAISGITGGGVDIPEEAFVISGDCAYKFTNGGWDWFINVYGDRITTSNISNANYMFNNANLSKIPFEINFTQGKQIDVDYMFYSCIQLKEIPKMNNCKPESTQSIFSYCHNLKELSEDIYSNWDWSYIDTLTSSYNGNRSGIFKGCRSLRNIPMSFLNHGNPVASNSYSIYSSCFEECSALDEITDIPFPHLPATWTTNAFSTTFKGCLRMKNITFALQDDGNPYTVNWKTQTIDLTFNVGYGSSYYLTDYNSGITADKQVTDEASYEALKNDPDWFTTLTSFSRYNHDSAVATINSLPDTSAYLASAGGTNTIKFQGTAGSATDGGAINTLTEEEIAVATAKGWTVTFV